MVAVLGGMHRGVFGLSVCVYVISGLGAAGCVAAAVKHATPIDSPDTQQRLTYTFQPPPQHPTNSIHRLPQP